MAIAAGLPLYSALTRNPGARAASGPYMAGGGMSNLRNDGNCFVCGPDSQTGLRLKPVGHDGRCSLTWIPESRFCGWEGVLHGGIVTAVLDETMAYAAMSLVGFCATVEIRVGFRRPVVPGVPIEVSASVTNRRGRMTETEAELTQEGVLKASATARFITTQEAPSQDSGGGRS